MDILGGPGAAGGSKAAFAMFQQKDIAAGGTGKVSRYSSMKAEKLRMSKHLKHLVIKDWLHRRIHRVLKNVFLHGVSKALKDIRCILFDAYTFLVASSTSV